MARKYKGSSLKTGNAFVMYGTSEMLKAIERAGGNVDNACMKLANETMKIVGEHSQAFMAKHKLTGETMSAYEQTPATIKGGKVVANVGYNIDKGGLPAIFLDVGTPKREPKGGGKATQKQKGHFWRYKAVNDSGQVEKIKAAQQRALNEILEGLK